MHNGHPYYKEILPEKMSRQLAGEVALFLNAEWMRAIPFFQSADGTESDNFVGEVG